MATQTISIKDVYTRKVGGDRYEYEVKYSPGESVTWDARVYQNGVLKGSTASKAKRCARASSRSWK